ncbi:hypothetical protein [Pedobacter agri]|uniref:HTH luxR-type domain-containing protein n=2 Tax=Pedobacter TaxID=84567 RepID=A0A9X3IBI2_9SPHI|nr:hypothetical protein [Pedobacter agri]MCX3267445.1 hypothetical protein [Pedobacter agri]
MEGYQYEEIANELQIPLETIKTSIRPVREILNTA